MYIRTLSLLILSAATFSLALAEPDKKSNASDTTTRQAGITEQELGVVLASDLAKAIKPPSTLAFSPDDLQFWAQKAKAIHKSAPVSKGEAAEDYDVIVQIGHYPRIWNAKATKREKATGGTGKYVTEQEIAALVGVGLTQKLSTVKINHKPLKVLLIGADSYTKGLKSKIFLSLHTDSAEPSCRVGPSVGYQKIGDAKGMHGIALALAITLGLDAQKFMRDNYTSNLSGYYSYSDFNTQYFKGLLEMSELSCGAQEEKLLERAAALSENLALAVQFALR